MLLVLIAVAVATVLSMSFLASQATTHGVAQNVQKHAQARSVAESALVAAIHYAQTDSGFRTDKAHGQWVANAAINGGTFDLFGYDGLDTDGDGVVDDTDGDLADDTSDPVTLTVVGYFDGVSHTVSAVVGIGGDGAALRVLMVVEDKLNLKNRDREALELIEGFGFTVDLISHDEAAEPFDAALSSAHVVFACGTATDAALGGKLLGAAAGIVSAQSGLNAALRVADSPGSGYIGTELDVLINNHYITSEVVADAMNDYRIAASAQTLSEAIGALGGGAVVLGTRSNGSTPTLVAVDVGGLLVDGGVAAGRRVLLPWGGSATDYKKMNAAGQALLRRSLEWAGQSVADDDGRPSLIALYEFQEVKQPPALLGHWRLDDDPGPMGFDTIYTSSQKNTENRQVATLVTLTEPMYVRRILAYVGGQKDENVRYAVYADNAGEPGGLIVQSPTAQPGSAAPGWFGIDVPVTRLDPGDYWLALSFEDDKLTYRHTTGGQSRENNNPAAVAPGGFVGTWGASSASSTRRISIYARGTAVTARDDLGRSDGTYLNGALSGETGFGNGGTAARFDGTNDHIFIPADDGLNFSGDFTLSGWFKLDNAFNQSTNRSQVMMSKYLSDDFDMIVALAGRDYNRASVPKGSLVFKIEGGSSFVGHMHYVWTSRRSWQAGRWYHFVCVLDGKFAPNNKVYIDGVDLSAGTENGPGSDALGLGFNAPVTIGGGAADRGQLVGWRYFDGVLDDIRIYDHVITDDQIAELSSTGEPSPDSVPVAYDTSSYGQPLDLDIQVPRNATWLPGVGLRLDSATRLLSNAAATKLHDALVGSDAFSIEAVFSPANVSQAGPARIVSYSGSATSRNVTLAQQADSLQAYLRTGATTANGTPGLDSGPVLTPATSQHVILSYDGTDLTLYRADGPTLRLPRTGELNWSNSFDFFLGNEAVNGYPWLGTFHRVAVYNRAFNQAQAQNVFNGLPPGDGGGVGSADWVEP